MDGLNINEVYFLHVQNASCSALVHFGHHLMHMLRSKLATEPNALLWTLSILSVIDFAPDSGCQCNARALANSFKIGWL